MSHNPNARRYCRSVRKWLPRTGKMYRATVHQLNDTVDGFISQNPDASWNDLVEHFGEPKEIAASYIDSVDTSELLKALRLRRRVFATILSVFLLIVVSWTAYLAWAAYKVQQISDAPYILVSYD